MRTDPRVLRSGATVTTPFLASVLSRVERVRLSASGTVRRSTYPMLLKALVPGDRKEHAALLNAAFGFSHGCEMYLLIRRLLPAANMEVSQ
jgi:hypothetical protein